MLQETGYVAINRYKMVTMLEAGDGYEPLVWQAGSCKHSNRQISWKLG